jgi:acyl-CoA dehydrogenase family protein 9
LPARDPDSQQASSFTKSLFGGDVPEEMAFPFPRMGREEQQKVDVSEKLLRTHREDIKFRQWHQKRLAHAVTDVYAKIAVLSRVTALLKDQGEEASGQERYIADTFCTRAGRRVERQLDQIEQNDDERMRSIARLTYRRGGYGLSLHPS